MTNKDPSSYEKFPAINIDQLIYEIFAEQEQAAVDETQEVNTESDSRNTSTLPNSKKSGPPFRGGIRGH